MVDGSSRDGQGWAVLVADEADGHADEQARASLTADPHRWATTLHAMVGDALDRLAAAGRIGDPGLRKQVTADVEAELAVLEPALDRALVAVGFPEPEPDDEPDDLSDLAGTRAQPAVPALPPAPPRLQASWSDGSIVVWAGGRGGSPLPLAEVERLAGAAGATAVHWSARRPLTLPIGVRADAMAAPVDQSLGWLVAVAAGREGLEVAPSVRWLAEVAAWGVELVAQGRVVPLLRRSTNKDGSARCRVRWAPALVDPQRVADLAGRCPGTVLAIQSGQSPQATVIAVLGAVVHTMCCTAATLVPSIPKPPAATTAAEVGESVLASLNGDRFTAAEGVAGFVDQRLSKWARPVAGETIPGPIVRLAEPDDLGAWLLSVHVTTPDGEQPVEVALGTSRGDFQRDLRHAYERLERLVPELGRPGQARQGQVVLSDAEAWELMTSKGPALLSAGFEVQVPALTRKSPSPTLRLFAEERGDSQVGAAQLVNVRWTVLFDDLELTAAEIARLSKQATPLVRTGGKWVHLDKADLAEAAAALAERASTTQMSGAAVLRQALGLEGGGARIQVDGSGWAAELLAKVSSGPPEPITEPEGFRGTLRSYQAEALGWLRFLDEAGLGGCLALDMGLGKTATVLARIATTASEGPTIAVVPQAVLTNWANEARRFAPGLRVRTHHGPNRADDIAAMAAKADLIITTFGTAVRDVEALRTIDWRRMVIDEAQNAKNPASETAQVLRAIPARSKVALTGTPIENGLGDLWAVLDLTNPGLVGNRNAFIAGLGGSTGGGSPEAALKALNGLLLFRRTKSEPAIAAELPDKIDELEQCAMTAEQVGLYQAVLDKLEAEPDALGTNRNLRIIAAITALKQICDHPAAYTHDDEPLAGRSGKLTRLEEVADVIVENGEKLLVFTHFAQWGERLAPHLSKRYGFPVGCYHGGLSRAARDQMVEDFNKRKGAGILVLSLKAGGTGLNLTAANHVVLYDRWWNPAVEDQARDRAWRIGQKSTVVSRRFVCPGTVDEKVEEVVEGKRRIADLVLPKASSLADLTDDQLRTALGLRADQLVAADDEDSTGNKVVAA